MTKETESDHTPKSERSLWARCATRLGIGLGWLVLAIMSLWVVGAFYYDVRIGWLQRPLALVYGVGMLAMFFLVKQRVRSMGIALGGFLVVLGWWLSLRPSNDRDWLPDLARLPHADIIGDKVTIHDIRNCNYRTETDFDVHYYDKAFDLSQLRTTDLYLVYWGSPYIAHTMVSFGFEGGDYVCFSIEVRKEKGEGYSAVKGFFRQFELTYVIADERDLVRLRTNYRTGEDVYLYRLKMTPEQMRTRFMAYVKRANHLYAHPEWYNALTDNCTTGIRVQQEAAKRARFDWRMIVNGKGDELLYERGAVDQTLPFAELKKLSLVNARGKAADQASDYAARIREGLPGTGGK